MYELQHNGDIAHITDKNTDFAALSDPLFAAVCQEEYPHLSLENWRHFVSGQENAALPASPVLDSWKRCLAQGVDPWMPNCTAFVPQKQIAAQAELAKSIAHDIEHDVYQAIRHRDLLLTLSDAQGQLLRTTGSKKILVQADSLRFGPGAVWTEKSVGTNAISMALDTLKPWQIRGEEHFCLSHHFWTCSATPIFNPVGELWGCIDISGHVSSDHRQALWLTMMAAREIERRLLACTLDRVEEHSRNMVKILLGTVPAGICLVNAQGIITFANPLAAHYLGTSQNLRGQPAGAYFQLTGLDLSSDLDTEPVSCLHRPDLSAEIAPLAIHPRERHYFITIHDTKPGSGLFAVPSTLSSAAGSSGQVQRRQPEQVQDPFADIIWQSDAMRAVIEQAKTMTRLAAPILLLGETGTGKELFARALHKAGSRADQPFVAVNCGALPRELIQSELFGYEKGSFTGANKSRRGKFEQAHEGTLFLDEISEMPLDMQVNLLRPLETGTVTRVGGSQSIRTDFRLITATNRNMEELVARGSFREDLFYRIHVLTLELPPLRARTGDVTLIAEAYGRRLAMEHKLDYSGFSSEALSCMESYDWPGNVRQLVHSVQYAVNMAMGARILPSHLPRAICGKQVAAAAVQDKALEQDFSLDNMEKRTIMAALEHFHGNILQAARALGIGRNTLYAKMRKYNLWES